MNFSKLKSKLITELSSANNLDEISDHIDQFRNQLISQKSFDGQYHIRGNNQDSLSSAYSGVLLINVLSENRISAVWTISNTQKQYGFGFYHDNLMIINFYYLDENPESNQKLKGVVVYKMNSSGNLEGFWSEKHGDDNFLGFEKAIRIQE